VTVKRNFSPGARALQVLEWPAINRELSQRARTPIGRHLTEGWKPGALSRAEALEQARAVLEALELSRQQNLQLPLLDIPDVTQLLVRISRSGAIGVEEFANLVRAHRAVQGLSVFLTRYAAGRANLVGALRGLNVLDEWARKNFGLLDGQGQIADSASEDLRALRSFSKDLGQRIERKLEDYLHNPRQQEVLQDSYITLREGRFVLPIKANFRGRVPGIIHDVSNSEATVFVEPQEIVEWNNQLKVVEKEIEREIERILAAVVERTKPFVPDMQQNLAIVAKADLVAASADLVDAWGGAGAAASWSPGTLAFEKLRHPLLALQRPVVPNSLSWKQGLVLTGPNTGGKTVLLKSVGLAVCLAWAGIPVPALAAEIPADLEDLYADIGDDQDLEQNLSTFSGHLTVLKEMLEKSGKGTLVLIDEIATGTAPEEGQPLAQAVIEKLLDRGARLLVTTHYATLKHFAMLDERCRIAAMGFESKNARPTYEILLDIPGESSAFDTAERLGIGSEIIDRARKLRGEVSGDLKQAVTRLEDARQIFLGRERDLEAQLEKARARESTAQAKILEYEAKQKQGLSEEAREILRKLAQVREEAAAAVKAATQDELRAGGVSLFKKISDAGEQIRGAVEEIRTGAGPQTVDDAELAADMPIEIEGLGLGTIVEVPANRFDPKAMILVQVGELRSRVSKARLRKPSAEQVRGLAASKAAMQSREKRFTLSSASAKPSAAGSFVCDVRGRTLDEALRRVQGSLNELLRNEDAIVTIVHGHGSEKLKEGIREYLTRERGELSFRGGQWPGEGGDGVTVVERTK
jgi:DNA mismatch repair protein MutS2